MRRLSPSLRPVLLLALLLAACDGGTGPDGEPEAVIGPEGGTVTSGPLTLEVPAGALAEPVAITATPITDASGGAPADFLVVDGTAFELKPDGLTFSEPATLSIRVGALPLPAGVSLPELRLLQLDGAGATLPSTVDAGQAVVSGAVEHFSSFGVGLPTQFSRVACPELSLAAASGMPLDSVGLGTLPSELEPPLFVVATAEDDSTRSYGGVEVDDQGGATMVVPIHPQGDPAGGPVRLNVSDGTRACEGVEFTIDGLPPAPGELAAVVELLQDVVDAQAAVLGVTTAEILATPLDSLAPSLIPLALVQSVIDHPENDHALRAIVDGTSSEAAEARLDLLEPLLARTGLRSALEGVAAAAAAEVEAEAAAAPADGTSFPPVAASVATELCRPEYVENPVQLDDCMDKAASAAFEGPIEKIMDGTSKTMMYLGLVPGFGTATAIGGAVIWVVRTEDKRNAALLPSLLTKLEVEPDPAEFLEDQEGPGSWTASVYATNQGYDLGKEFLEGALQGTGVSSIADKAQIAGPEVGHLTGWVLTGPVANKLLEGATIDEFVIEASDYGPIPVNEDDWTESMVEGDAFSRRSHSEYDPEAAGTATLRIRTLDDVFAGQQIEGEAELEVTELWLSISPDEEYVGADEPVAYTVTVFNAEHPERVAVVDEASLQGTVDAVTYEGGSLHSVQYTAPSDPDPSRPDRLIVEDTASTGAREGSTERRLTIATIRFGEVEISPRDPCVANGDPETFTADTTGLGNATIGWEIVSGDGSLSSTTGASVDYMAPNSGTGSVTLRAFVVGHEDNQDQVTFTYGVCSGLAVYRVVTAEIGFPFSPGGTCNNPDLDESYEEDDFPEGGIDPLVPPDPSVMLVDRTRSDVIDLGQSGAVGGNTENGCVYATFQSLAGYDANFTGSPAADSVDIDIQTYGQSECIDMGSELGVRCSGAVGAVGTTVRFDLDIDRAASYDFDLELTCDAYVLPTSPEPTIDIVPVRVEPDGTYLPPNATTQPMSLACGGGNTATLDHVLEFADPAEPGQTDHVMIMIQFSNGSPGAIEGISEGRHEGYIQGYITLRKQ